MIPIHHMMIIVSLSLSLSLSLSFSFGGKQAGYPSRLVKKFGKSAVGSQRDARSMNIFRWSEATLFKGWRKRQTPMSITSKTPKPQNPGKVI